jgi:positive regulator of sigma E activity
MKSSTPWPAVGTLITSSATVIETKQTVVLVRIGESCSANKSCGHSCSCGHGQPRKARRSVAVAKPSSWALAPGEQVLIRHFTPNPSFAALLLFGLPLLFCALELALWDRLLRGTAGNAIEALACLSALCLGAGVGFGIEWLVERRYPSSILSSVPQ